MLVYTVTVNYLDLLVFSDKVAESMKVHMESFNVYRTDKLNTLSSIWKVRCQLLLMNNIEKFNLIFTNDIRMSNINNLSSAKDKIFRTHK